MAKKSAPKRSSSEDAAFERAAKKAAGTWKKAREVKDEFAGGLKFGEIDDGEYEARTLGARIGVTKKGEGDIYISIDFALLDPQFDGKKVDVYHDLKDESTAERMAKTLLRMGYELNNDKEPVNPHDLKEIVADINKTKPDVVLRIANKDKDAQGKKYDTPKAFVNVQRVVEEAAPPPAKRSRKK